MHVVTREAETWKSRVNATIPPARSRFGNLCLAMLPTRPTDQRYSSREP